MKRPIFRTGYVEKRHALEVLPDRPWKPVVYDAADAAALQAMRDGRASSDQQRRAMGWILLAAGGGHTPYVPGDPHDTAFAAGKHYVGEQIKSLLALRLSDNSPPWRDEQSEKFGTED